MSLILEALRKSEAERRRGQAPGLFVDQLPARAHRRAKAPGWAWALGALLLVVLLAWGWREAGRLGAGDATPAGGGAHAAVADTPIPAADTTQDAAPAGGRTDASPTLPTPAGTGPGGGIDAAAPRHDPGMARDVAKPAAPDAGASPRARDLGSNAPPTGNAIPASGDVEPVVASTPPAGDPPRPTTTGAAAAPAPVGAADGLGGPDSATATDEALPRLSDLPGSERGQLPPLKLTMHVFAEDPAQRFVILDGRRQREGDSPAAGLVIERIRRDGLVLSVNGRRWLLARP